MFCAYNKKSDDDNIDGYNDNYDINYWNFEDNGEKMTKKQSIIMTFK